MFKAEDGSKDDRQIRRFHPNVLMPMNICNNHWILVVLDVQAKRATSFNEEISADSRHSPHFQPPHLLCIVLETEETNVVNYSILYLDAFEFCTSRLLGIWHTFVGPTHSNEYEIA